MKTLSGSILIMAGAIMFGAANLAQAIAATAGWQDTPVSMRVIGSAFTAIGFAVFICGLITDRSRWQAHMQMLSGSVLVLSGAIVFGCGKAAMATAAHAGRRDIPVFILVLGCTFSICGLAVLAWGLFRTRKQK